MVVPLEQARFRIDELHLDRLQIVEAEIGALEDRLAAGEGGFQERRDVAGAVVESGPIGVAAIIGIAELVRRLAVPADAARKGQEIGRPACRGRVCQYGLTPGGTGS